MKTKFKIMTLLVSAMALGSCTTADDVPHSGSVSEQAKSALLAKYPSATNIRWQIKDKYVVASFALPASRTVADGGNDLSAWFDNGGAWYMTETDILFTMLPEAVRTAFGATEYASAPWTVDDVDKLEREGVETVYVIEARSTRTGSKPRWTSITPPTGCW